MRILIVILFLASVAAAVVAQPAPVLLSPVHYEEDFLSGDFHRSRRQDVLNTLPQNAVAVFFSAPVRTRQNDVSYEYRQDSDFYYLTGAHEAGSVLLLAKEGLEINGQTVNEVLLVPPRDPEREIWNGRLMGTQRAQETLGIELALPNTEFESVFDSVFNDGNRYVYYLPIPEDVSPSSALGRQLEYFVPKVSPFAIVGSDFDRENINRILGIDDEEMFGLVKRYLADRPIDSDKQRDLRVAGALEAFGRITEFSAWLAWKKDNLPRHNVTLLRSVLDRSRAVKTDEELRLLQKAIDITSEAHLEAFRSIEPGMKEYEVEALIEYIFKRNGAEYPGFPSIVGSGENSIILHYESNRRTMEAGDLVLMDIGAEYHGYTADITRTVPVSGTYSPEQRKIYDIVNAASDAAIEASRAGSPFWAPHRAASEILARGLADLGLISSPSSSRELGRFFMHGTSHYLGLDVHDVGDYNALKPGHVITIEPGLYIAPSDDIDPVWWNIGIRIEDDVLITDGDPVVLTVALTRDPDEIEAIMEDDGLGNVEVGK